MKTIYMLLLFTMIAIEVSAQKTTSKKTDLNFKSNIGKDYLSKAESQIYIGGTFFLVGAFAWGANQYQFFGKDATQIKAYNLGGVAFMATGLVFQVLAVQNLIDYQRAKASLTLKVCPANVALTFKF